MTLIIVILIIAGLTIAIIETAKRRNPNINLSWLPIWASLPIPVLFVLYWLFSLWWLQSTYCTDVATCGSNGVAAMTKGAAIGLFGSFFVSMTTSILWINWRNRK